MENYEIKLIIEINNVLNTKLKILWILIPMHDTCKQLC